jgi:hypothetical protein
MENEQNGVNIPRLAIIMVVIAIIIVLIGNGLAA